MITKKMSLIISVAFLVGFIVSLSLDLHGAVAVFTSLGFLFFLSASVKKNLKVVWIIKIILGVILLLLSANSLVAGPDTNKIFVISLSLAGLLLVVDPITSWVIKK